MGQVKLTEFEEAKNEISYEAGKNGFWYGMPKSMNIYNLLADPSGYINWEHGWESARKECL